MCRNKNNVIILTQICGYMIAQKAQGKKDGRKRYAVRKK